MRHGEIPTPLFMGRGKPLRPCRTTVRQGHLPLEGEVYLVGASKGRHMCRYMKPAAGAQMRTRRGLCSQ